MQTPVRGNGAISAAYLLLNSQNLILIYTFVFPTWAFAFHASWVICSQLYVGYVYLFVHFGFFFLLDIDVLLFGRFFFGFRWNSLRDLHLVFQEQMISLRCINMRRKKVIFVFRNSILTSKTPNYVCSELIDSSVAFKFLKIFQIFDFDV